MPIEPRPAKSAAHLPTLIIVSGVPGTGKSTLAHLLRNRLGWPLIANDRIKETLFDAAGDSTLQLTRELSTRYGRQAQTLLHMIARQLLESGVSCIIESYFLPSAAAAELTPLIFISHARQIHCAAPAEISIARYRHRFEAGLRHPVHLDREEAAERASDPIPESELLPVPIDTPLLSVDTRNGYIPALAAILEFSRS